MLAETRLNINRCRIKLNLFLDAIFFGQLFKMVLESTHIDKCPATINCALLNARSLKSVHRREFEKPSKSSAYVCVLQTSQFRFNLEY